MTKVKCMICGREFEQITGSHLKKEHKLTMQKYREMFPDTSLISDETAQKISSALIGREITWGEKISESSMGRKHTEESKQKMSISRKGVKFTELHKQHLSESLTGRRNYWQEGDKNQAKRPEVRKKISESLIGENNPMYGKHHTKEEKERQSERTKALWMNPEYIKKVVEGQHKKFNTKEYEVRKILEKFIPNEYKFNGNYDCGISIGRMIPDFVNVNGKKKAIEMNGCYFHNCPICFPKGGIDNDVNGIEETEKRVEQFKQYGWDCLIIWEHELEDKKTVVNKILNFHGLSLHSYSKQLSIDDIENMKRGDCFCVL